MVRAVFAFVLCALVACKAGPKQPDAPTSPWSLGPTLPDPRLEPGVTAMGQQLIVVGGFDMGLPSLNITARIDVLDVTDLAHATWTQLPDAPFAGHHLQVAAIGTTLYLLGGLGATLNAMSQYVARGDAWALDTLAASPVWRPLAAMPAGAERGSAAIIVVPPRIYLFGGAGTSNALATNLYYDTAANTWGTDVPDLPAPRSHPAAMRRTDGTFVVTGGLAGLYADSAAADTWTFTPTQTAWQPVAAMPIARGGCAYGTVQGQLVCAGGEAGTSALSYVQSYDPFADTWTDNVKQYMPMPTAGTQGAAIGVRLFVPGGSRSVPTITSGFAPTDTLYVFSPLDTAP